VWAAQDRGLTGGGGSRQVIDELGVAAQEPVVFPPLQTSPDPSAPGSAC